VSCGRPQLVFACVVTHLGIIMARSRTDWTAIEAAYCGGPVSVQELARTHGLHPDTIRRRAREEGWTRPTEVSNPEPDILPPARGAEARRTVIEQGQAVTLRLLDELLAASARIGELEALIAAATEADDEPSRRDALERAVSLPRRSAALRDIAAAARLWIDLERQALGLDGGAGEQAPRIDVALRLLGPEQREQLRRIADVLAARPAGPAAGA
jgi:transposase-like protein